MMPYLLVLLAATQGVTDDLDLFFEDFAKQRDQVETVSATFSQKAVQPDDVVETEGTLRFIRPRRIIFEQQDPKIVRLIDDLRLFEYDPELEQLQVVDIEASPQADIFFFGFDQNTDALRDAYDVSLLLPENDNRGLQIRPKLQDREDAVFEEVTIYFRAEDLLPDQITIVYDEQSRVILSLRDYVVNAPLDPAETQIALAEGTKIIENDTPIETVGAGGKLVPEPASGKKLAPPEPMPEQDMPEGSDVDLAPLEAPADSAAE